MELKAFLSHRYKSPDVNLYFFDIFSHSSEIQFDVDIGSAPTCVTRLERMIRNSDAFIGIYPFPGDPARVATQNDLLNASKYFRLECELAARSKLPCLVFYDQRYGDIFNLPRHIHNRPFNYQEISGGGGTPSRRKFERVFQSFEEEVAAAMEFAVIREMEYERKSVGIIVPHATPSANAYTEDELDVIKQSLSKKGFNTVKQIRWPLVFDTQQLSEIDAMDFAVIDVGDDVIAAGIVGFLHGRFIPCVRLLRDGAKNINSESILNNLYGALPVGYAKDIVRFQDKQQLEHELNLRLEFIKSPTQRINTSEEAKTYFRKAEMRKDSVFLSYSGNDSEIASKISTELKKRFQSVFDYQDGKSITPGQPWLGEIFEKLSGSKLGISLVSANYLNSGNCEHEALKMYALRDAGKISVIPVKLYDEKVKWPEWMSSTQYIRYYNYADVKSLVDHIIESFDQTANKEATSQ